MNIAVINNANIFMRFHISPTAADISGQYYKITKSKFTTSYKAFEVALNARIPHLHSSVVCTSQIMSRNLLN